MYDRDHLNDQLHSELDRDMHFRNCWTRSEPTPHSLDPEGNSQEVPCHMLFPTHLEQPEVVFAFENALRKSTNSTKQALYLHGIS